MQYLIFLLYLNSKTTFKLSNLRCYTLQICCYYLTKYNQERVKRTVFAFAVQYHHLSFVCGWEALMVWVVDRGGGGGGGKVSLLICP